MLNIDPRSTDELIRLALDAPEEDEDALAVCAPKH